MRRFRIPMAPMVLLIAAACAEFALPAGAAVRPNDPMDGAEMRQALRKLGVVGSALYVAAHPDDENTAFIAWLSQGRCVRTAYLAMTRGDGGQNLIGTETGAELGVLRTQELLAARRVDGGEQFFTRALDFGYSKTTEETMKMWDRERILADAVWIIRRFRPDVIVTRFGVDGGGGHGHHTASAVLAEEAFRAAADPARFPEQLKSVRVWQAKRILWNNWSPRTAGRAVDAPPILSVDLGEWNPLLGRAYTEMAGQSRSMHKSQGFGAPERRGSIPNWFEHRDGEPAKSDLFDGVDLTWSRFPGGARVGALIAEAARAFDESRPSLIVPKLLEAYDAMGALAADPLIDAKRRELLELVRSCAGLWVETIAASPSTTPGATLRVTTSVLQRSDLALSVQSVAIANGAVKRWTQDTSGGEFLPTRSVPAEGAGPFALAANRSLRAEAEVAIPRDMPLTQPYWLEKPLRRGSFDVDRLELIGTPENAPPLVARVALALGAHRFELEAPVVYKWTDPVRGERYRPLEIAPPLTCRLEESVFLFPGPEPRRVRVVVNATLADTAAIVRLRVPEGFGVSPPSAKVRAFAGGVETPVDFTVTPPAKPAAGFLTAEAEVGGRIWSRRVVRIDHDHIPIQTLYPPAEARLVRVNVQASGGEVGYVMGSGDQVPDALRQLGFKVTLLSDEDLETQPLSRFEALVVGVRAYNTRDRLRALQPRFMEYVRSGGRMVVQYNTADTTLDERIGPYRFRISRDRVTVEEAEMRAVAPGHELLTRPNRIEPSDWEGWVQERGLYFANPWDSHYEAVLSANDPGESAKDGSLLYARYGQGAFIYTGLAWFRQLPAGVPGAYRLFANLVSHPAHAEPNRP